MNTLSTDPVEVARAEDTRHILSATLFRKTYAGTFRLSKLMRDIEAELPQTSLVRATQIPTEARPLLSQALRALRRMTRRLPGMLREVPQYDRQPSWIRFVRFPGEIEIFTAVVQAHASSESKTHGFTSPGDALYVDSTVPGRSLAYQLAHYLVSAEVNLAEALASGDANRAWRAINDVNRAAKVCGHMTVAVPYQQRGIRTTIVHAVRTGPTRGVGVE